jgi:hypothetical protein
VDNSERDTSGQFKDGHPPLPGCGRKAGVPNKLNQKVKEAIEQALEELGGVEYLKGVAKSDPAVFCSLVGKLIPKDISVEVGQKLGDLLDDIIKGKQR